METKLAAIAVIIKDNKILLGRKSHDKGPYPGTWHLIGGGVRFGKETVEEALSREVKEETNLDVEIIRRIAWDSDVQNNKHGVETYYVYLQFLCKPIGGKLIPGDDINHAEWVDIDKLGDYELNEPTIKVLKKMGFI